MAAIYADHPFQLIPTPIHTDKIELEDADLYDRCASEMALVHNMMIRGLNAIYLQAPHVQAKDYKGFTNFIIQWYNLLHIHHTGEEKTFFPLIEELTGEKGLMETNVEQHHAFEKGLEAFAAYAKAVAADEDQFDGEKIIKMIDSFGEPLRQHLWDEIPTIVGLRKYADKLGDLTKMFDKEGEENMKKLGLMGLCHCFAALDLSYEDGLWADWPPAPGVVKFLCRNVLWWFGTSSLKFGACDRQGKMQPLYAVPEQGKTAN